MAAQRCCHRFADLVATAELMSKLQKLLENPRRFFRDSPHPALRLWGRVLDPLFDVPFVRELLIDPCGALAASRVPVLSSWAQSVEAEATRSRRALCEQAGEPLVSVVMPAHDAAATIEAAVESLLAQSYPHLELVIVDDASSDATRDVIESLARRDDRIVVAGHDDNRGAARTRNVGLRLARGELVTFNDADDRAHPERIERQLEPLLRRESIVMSVCQSQREDASGRTVAINDRLRGKAVISMMFRREMVLERLGFFRSMPVSEDAEYYERIKAVFGDAAVATCRQTLLFQRFSPGSLLFSDGTLEVVGSAVTHARSVEADRALVDMRANIEKIRAGTLDPYVAFEP